MTPQQLRAKQRPRPPQTWRAGPHETTQEIPMITLDPEPKSIGGDTLFAIACVIVGALMGMAIIG